MAGEVDDASIPDGAVLWRRIPPDRVQPDAAQPADESLYPPRRPSSTNFNGEKGLDGSQKPRSVFVAHETTIEAVMQGNDSFGLVSITVGQARSHGRGIVRLTEGGAGHCDLFVQPGASANSVRKNGEKLARLAKWVVVPPQFRAEFERARIAAEQHGG